MPIDDHRARSPSGGIGTLVTDNHDLLRMPDFALDGIGFAPDAQEQVNIDDLHVSFVTRRAVEEFPEGAEVDAIALGNAPMLVLIPGQDEQGRNMLHLDSTGFTASEMHQLLAAALDAVCATINSGSLDPDSLDLAPEQGYIVPMGGTGHGH